MEDKYAQPAPSLRDETRDPDTPCLFLLLLLDRRRRTPTRDQQMHNAGRRRGRRDMVVVFEQGARRNNFASKQELRFFALGYVLATQAKRRSFVYRKFRAAVDDFTSISPNDAIVALLFVGSNDDTWIIVDSMFRPARFFRFQTF
jgi:hypothetical protein